MNLREFCKLAFEAGSSWLSGLVPSKPSTTFESNSGARGVTRSSKYICQEYRARAQFVINHSAAVEVGVICSGQSIDCSFKHLFLEYVVLSIAC